MTQPEPGSRASPADREPDMNLSVEIIRSSGGWDALEPACANAPSSEESGLERAIDAAARSAFAAGLASGEASAGGERFDGSGPAELSIVLACDGFVQELNRQFRGQDKPTNVLSFPAEPLPSIDLGDEPAPLGDVIVAWETLLREAEAEGKTPLDHLRHLVVHGTLHLLGFDHQDDGEAERMEGLEREALARLGVADPYREASNSEPINHAGETGGTRPGATCNE